MASALLSPLARADYSEIELDDIQDNVPPELCHWNTKSWHGANSVVQGDSGVCHYRNLVIMKLLILSWTYFKPVYDVKFAHQSYTLR